LLVALGVVSRDALSPDGVSYLDLAATLRRGDVAHFVQGYWSPLFPALLAGVTAFTGSPEGQVRLVHALNVVIGVAAVGIVWRSLRHTDNAPLARMSFAALLLSSTRPPRVDAITPDLLLLALLLAATIELLFHDGRRWVRIGLLFGLAFLVKTSIWPWLLVLTAARLGLGRRALRPVLNASAVTVAIMLLWIVPLSIREGRPTLGSAARLNYCWYLEACDSRTPDTHRGTHREYRTTQLSSGATIQWASFEGTPWTYLPWSDPTQWAAGVLTSSAHSPAVLALLRYWTTNTLVVLGKFLPALLACVLLPAYLTRRRADPWRALSTDARNEAMIMLLGLAGIAQFIAVHAEPRLIAPFALMFVLGALAWLQPSQELQPTVGRRGRAPHATDRPGLRDQLRTPASVVGLAMVLPFAYFTLRDQSDMQRRIVRRAAAIEGTRLALVPGGVSMGRIVIAGPAVPFIMDAYRSGGRIVAQVLPTSARALEESQPTAYQKAIGGIFAGRADVIWFTKEDERFTMVPLDHPVR
jgi:hypothetical protein